MAIRLVVCDTLLTGLLQTVRLLGGVLLLPVLLGSLGTYAYGLVALGVSICTYSAMLESVLTPVLRNQLNSAVALEKIELVAKLQRVARTAAGLVLCGAFLLAGLILTTMLFVSKTSPYVGVVLVCILSIALAAIGGIIDCLFSARDGLWLLRVYEISGTLIGFLAAAIFAYGKFAPAFVLASLVAAPHIPKIIAWKVEVLRCVFDGNNSFSELKNFIKDHGHNSKDFFFLQLFLCFLSTFPTIFISMYLGLEATTLWTTVQRVVAVPGSFLVSLMPVLWPRVTRALAKGHNKLLKSVFVGGILSIIFTFVIWIAASLYWRYQIFNFLTNRLVVPPSGLVSVMGVLILLATCNAWISTFLNAAGDFISQLRQSFLTLIASIALGIIGAQVAGSIGLAVGLAFALFILSVVPTAANAWRKLQSIS